MSVMALLNKNAGSVKGYNYTKPGHDTPVNLLNLPPDEQSEALKWYDEHSPSGSVQYLKNRIALEKALRGAALKKLGDDVVEHPLYFQVGEDANGGFGGASGVRGLSDELMRKSTFYPGDSFDALKSSRENKTTLARELKRIMTLDELKNADRSAMRLRDRKHGNYVEGQLWAPFKVEGDELKAVDGDGSSEIEKSASLSQGEIKDYIKRYYEASDDEAHGPDHIALVRKNMSELADKQGYKDKELADAAALLHDIGNIKDRKRHEIVGADMAASDPLLAKRFDKRRLRLLVNAIRQHRASTGKPRSVLGKMLSDSDRLSSWPNSSAGLRRAMAFGRKHEPELSDDEQLDRSVAHQIGKYGPGGYGLKATYFPESAEHINKMMIPLLKADAEGNRSKLREMAGLDEMRKTANLVTLFSALIARLRRRLKGGDESETSGKPPKEGAEHDGIKTDGNGAAVDDSGSDDVRAPHIMGNEQQEKMR